MGNKENKRKKKSNLAVRRRNKRNALKKSITKLKNQLTSCSNPANRRKNSTRIEENANLSELQTISPSFIESNETLDLNTHLEKEAEPMPDKSSTGSENNCDVIQLQTISPFFFGSNETLNLNTHLEKESKPMPDKSSTGSENNCDLIQLQRISPFFFGATETLDKINEPENEAESVFDTPATETLDKINELENEAESVLDTPATETLDKINELENEAESVLDTPPVEDDFYVVKQGQGEESNKIGGRRIIDIKYFFSRMQEISSHNSLFGCNLQHMKLIGEKRIGLISHIKFKCELCSQKFVICSDDPKQIDNIDVNSAACSGIVASGIGYSQFEEICSSIDIPVFTEKYFSKVQDHVFDEWEATAIETMEKAAKREREAAIKEGKIKDGIPIIDVYADGAWCTRSYGNNYRALSGVAAIVGRRFGEVLFIGVKNKYCLVCARSQKENKEPKEHVCYKNYDGPSSGMETAIICEGFKQSVKMYGLIYGNLIADGDSSTYSKILETNPYPNHIVSKIECRNHVLRNLCNKMRALVKDTKYPIAQRKLLDDKKVMSIRKVITTSIKTRKEQPQEQHDDAIKLLHGDITNSVNHAFGDHRKCKEHYCHQEKSFSSSVIPKLENTVLWFRVRAIISNVAAKSRSLIQDVDTNNVERFNSIVAKFVGGKRLNFALRRSYQSRCSAAVVAFNTKRPVYTLQKRMLGRSPRNSLKKIDERKEKKRALANVRTRKKLRFKQVQKNHDYGDAAAAPDMSEDMLERAKEDFFKNLKELVKDRDGIQKRTVLQRDSSEWLYLRKVILTASNFGKVVRRRRNPGNCVKQILYKRDISHVKSVAHGINNEQIAIQQLAAQENLTINPCGLYIHQDYDFLGASPDGTVGEDTTVEVKCPVAAYKIGMEKAIRENKVQIYRYRKKTGKITVNKKSDWYYQAQGQLQITNRQRCIFGLWGGENQLMNVVYIQRDDIFWENVMKRKLIDFYNEHLVPELVDSRQTRGMPLRGLEGQNK